MNAKINISEYAHGRLAGSRLTAAALREERLNVALFQHAGAVVLDFSGIAVTPSFVDELIGVLVLRHGPDVLARMIFKGCSDDVRAVIEFVTTDRCEQFSKIPVHLASADQIKTLDKL